MEGRGAMTSLSEREVDSEAGHSSADLRSLTRRIMWTDVISVGLAVTLSHLARFGSSGLFDPFADRWDAELPYSTTYLVISLCIIAAWLLMLEAYSTRSPRVLGAGDTEFKRIFRASLILFGVIAILAYATRFDLARGYVALAFPMGLVLLLATRFAWRLWLRAERAAGRMGTRTVLLGSGASVARVMRQLQRDPSSGFHVIGVYVPDADRHLVPDGDAIVVGDIADGMAAAGTAAFDTVIVTSSDAMTGEDVRRMSWKLTPGTQHLIMAPKLTDVGGPRIHVRPVAGLPLVHVEMPRYRGAQAWMKRAFDVALSAALLLVLSLPLMVVAIAIRVSSPGPIIFRQQRVGRHGEEFSMLKFRSMVADAEAQLDTLLDREDRKGNAVLFKMQDDPRVTRIGTFIRRFSIDELPQLINVLRGDMSIVGPRPPLAREVEQYEEHVRRRFLVKPGLTGLWQVSGRSNLSWEDSVRLDLYYVENWSLVSDLGILARTARAVVARDGAY